MANLVINNTSKADWVTYIWNDYYTNGTCSHKEQYERETAISAVDIIKIGGNECVEIMNEQDFSIFLTHTASNQFFVVDSINGVAPVSLTDLRDKILALL